MRIIVSGIVGVILTLLVVGAIELVGFLKNMDRALNQFHGAMSVCSAVEIYFDRTDSWPVKWEDVEKYRTEVCPVDNDWSLHKYCTLQFIDKDNPPVFLPVEGMEMRRIFTEINERLLCLDKSRNTRKGDREKEEREVNSPEVERVKLKGEIKGVRYL